MKASIVRSLVSSVIATALVWIVPIGDRSPLSFLMAWSLVFSISLWDNRRRQKAERAV